MKSGWRQAWMNEMEGYSIAKSKYKEEVTTCRGKIERERNWEGEIEYDRSVREKTPQCHLLRVNIQYRDGILFEELMLNDKWRLESK